MLETLITHHAARRLQQRGIPDDILPLLMQFGAREYDKRGAKLIYLTHKGRERIRRTVGADLYNRLEPVLDIYAVVDTAGTVVTVGHRTHRINRN
ncbi:hypothetical protein CGK74_11415 [Thauera propionica]|uniref:DUF4258 domain-containing protein n=1 Tax=Thauera propionica TaxID=2019431 RepID=A0A235EZ09_9RHOO|nr:hypothetical protein [Thauera propionica]OYD53807.1 hypothetical protein CGK74_11415 [Thauera propionica]